MFKPEIKSDKNEDICILIKVENHSFNYICECGEAKSLGVKECQNTNAIFISHTHIDHFVNFDTILRHQIGIKRKVVIIGPSGIIDQVQHRIRSYCWNLIDKDAICYEIREIQTLGSYKSATLTPPFWNKHDEKTVTSEVVFSEKNFDVQYEILDHNTPSIAYLFKGHDKTKIQLSKDLKGGQWVSQLKNAFDNNDENQSISIDDKEYLAKDLFDLITVEKGKKLGVIMDHAANENNHKLIKKRFDNCNDVFIECFYKDEDKESATKNAHSYASKSGDIMKQCQVTNAVPVHFSRKYSDNEIEEIINQFNKSKNHCYHKTSQNKKIQQWSKSDTQKQK